MSDLVPALRVFEELGSPASPGEADELERMVGPLPEQYLEFLSLANGGRFQDWTRYGGGRFGGLDEMFSTRAGGPSSATLLEMRGAMGGRLPAGVLAIGDDQSGNLICIGINESNLGRIFRWDHERESLDSAALDLVATDLAGFLGGITVG